MARGIRRSISLRMLIPCFPEFEPTADESKGLGVERTGLKASSSKSEGRRPASERGNMASSDSVDEELAATAQHLSLRHIPTNLEDVRFVMPKIYPELYGNSPDAVARRLSALAFRDGSSGQAGIGQGGPTDDQAGVPGFPDFPACWQGRTSSSTKGRRNTRKNPEADEQMKNAFKRHGPKWKVKASNRQQRFQRQAANLHGIASRPTPAKKEKRDERRARRLEKVMKLQERRRRKREMGEICRGMSSIKCK